MNRPLIVGIVGLVAGLTLGQVLHADAQTNPGKFKECFTVTRWSVMGKELNSGEFPSKMTQIPNGWTVMGGSGAGNSFGILLCR